MKLFFAGYAATTEQAKDLGIKNKLYSYANDKNSAVKWGSEGLMLDSGAFSVFTGRCEVDIDEHLEYVKKLQPEYSIQLDVIGNEDATWENYLYQRDSIPDILPVIHYQASEKHIKRVADNAEYILLGGLVPLSMKKPTMYAWLDYLFSNFLNKKKVHLLGVTSESVLRRYPAYSSDSTAWFSPRAFGRSARHKDNNMTSALTKIDVQKQIRLEVEHYLKLENELTRLWEKRGIVWED